MTCTRRKLGLFLQLLLAAKGHAVEKTPLRAKAYRFEDLQVRAKGQNRSRSILDGTTHTGFPIELHESELAPGAMPHPPHHHEHEEVFLIREGALEVTIAGERARLGPGSVGYVASNVEHGIKNVGTSRAQYFVIALGREKT